MSPTATRTHHESEGIDLRHTGATLRRHVQLILFCGVLFAGLAFLYSSLQEKEYTATATLLFRDPGFDQRLFGTQFVANSTDPDRDAATNLGLADLSVTAKQTAQELGGHYTEAIVHDKVVAVPVTRSDLVGIKATDPSPRVAALLANTFTKTFVRLRREADISQIRGAQVLVQHQLDSFSAKERASEQGQSVAKRAQELKILASLQTGKAQIAQAADVPTSPSGPRKKRNTAIGLLLGLLAGTGLAFLRERLDRRLTSIEQAESLFDRPVLGAVPKGSRLGGQRPVPESFHMLRTNLRYFNVSADVQTLLVTSAGPGDGKSTVSAHLALASAEAGVRTLLVEADLRNPSLRDVFKAPVCPGLSDLLSRRASWAEVVQEIPVPSSSGTGVASDRSLDVVFAGPIPPNPYDLLDSKEMKAFVSRVSHDYEYVVVDTPPATTVPDAMPLVGLVSGVIVVARVRHTETASLRRLHDQLALIDAPILGLVINAVGSGAEYGYGYGYGYDALKAELPNNA